MKAVAKMIHFWLLRHTDSSYFVISVGSGELLAQNMLPI